MNVYILKIHVYVQILLDEILNFIKQLNFKSECDFAYFSLFLILSLCLL